MSFIWFVIERTQHARAQSVATTNRRHEAEVTGRTPVEGPRSPAAAGAADAKGSREDNSWRP